MSEAPTQKFEAQQRRFRSYSEYKDSGVEWLGEIPAQWEVKPLKRVAEFRGGGTPSKDNPDYWRGEIPWVSPKDMKVSVVVDTEDKITAQAVRESATNLVPAGAVLLVVRSGILVHSIPVAIAGREVTLNQDLKALIPSSEMIPEYLMYLVSGLQRELLAEWKKQGATVESLKLELVACTLVPLPNDREQRAIVAFLDRETATIDALVAKNERLIELLQEKRTALMAHAVTKGLEPDVPMKDSGVEWLGEIPAHWNTRQGRYLYRALKLRPQERDGVVTAYRDGQVTLRENRRAEGYTFAIQEVGYQRVRAGDLVIQGMDAFAGAIGVSDSTGKCSPEYLVLAPTAPETDNRYFAAALRLMAKRGFILVVCNAVRERAPRFRVPEFRNVVLPQPPANEQHAVAALIDREAAGIDALVAKVREAIALLKELRTALISAAVTGKIDVREEAA